MTIKQPPIPDAVAALRAAIEPLRVFFADKYLELAFKEALKQDIPDTKAEKRTPRTSDKIFVEKLREKFGNITFKAEDAAKALGMSPGGTSSRLPKIAKKGLLQRTVNNPRNIDYCLPLEGM